MKARGGEQFGLMEIPKNAKFVYVVQMAKNLVHSFYCILYQPKGVPTSSQNFSGTGGTYLEKKVFAPFFITTYISVKRKQNGTLPVAIYNKAPVPVSIWIYF